VTRFLLDLSEPMCPCRVVYLHGRYDRPQDIVFTETSYVDRYIKDTDARQGLLAIFMTHPVVFVGFSMNDPDLANLMREVTARLVSSEPCHLALIGFETHEDRDLIRERMRGKFGSTSSSTRRAAPPTRAAAIKTSFGSCKRLEPRRPPESPARPARPNPSQTQTTRRRISGAVRRRLTVARSS
jgi:hypothetical protein